MPELQLVHRSVMDPDNNADDEEDALPMQPLDIDEQEELIQNLEKGNSKRNLLYVNALTGVYAFIGISFLYMMKKCEGKESWIYGLGCLSIVLSNIDVRHETITNFQVFMTSRLQMGNVVIRRLNIAILILVEWLIFNELPLGLTSQVPLFLFVVSILSKRWVRSMEDEISVLRGMKYKYKSA